MRLTCLNNADFNLPSLFKPFGLKMEEAGLHPIVINIFKCYYSRLAYGAQAKLTEREIMPVSDKEVRPYETLGDYAEAGRKALKKTVVIKLNGGLGTSMGLEKAKSIIPIKDGLTFLQIIVRQVSKLRERYGVELPLCLMNSFKTHYDSMLMVEGFDNSKSTIPLAFLQNRYPKILERDLSPANWPDNRELEWNPPGHGDLFTALVTASMLPKLLAKGYRYAFVSNSDNLGALMDERILGYLAKKRIPFLMEVARRTATDNKGGHLARLLSNGRLILRETAQCAENDWDAFMDVEKHRFFNTNSIWFDLKAFEQVFLANGMMPLDLIINPKTLDPRDASSPAVLQIETAMGSAISAYENSRAVLVPRSRFAPVKTTSDLLLIMSDCYVRNEDEAVVPNLGDRLRPMPQVCLDPRFYKKIDDFNARFPHGAPSLIEADCLDVRGDVRFGKDVKVVGKAVVINETDEQAVIPDGAVLTDEVDASAF